MFLGHDPVIKTVQHNCHISDAQFAADYPLCIYLLKMREFYRWEHGLELDVALPREKIGAWLNERESLWQRIEADPFQNIILEGQTIDVFNSEAINQLIEPQGYIYSAGFGVQGKPYFFLGRLSHKEERQNCRIYIAQQEYARELTAPPAMSNGKDIFIRFESLRRLIWEKVEEWRWTRHAGPMERIVTLYELQASNAQGFDTCAQQHLSLMIYHEMGEISANQYLGQQWRELIAVLPSRKAELMARAIKDWLADCLVTLPQLLKSDASQHQLHFFMAMLSPLRKHLFPLFNTAYQQWWQQKEAAILFEAVARGKYHFEQITQKILILQRENPAEMMRQLETMLDGGAVL